MAESSRLPALTDEVLLLDSVVGNDPVWRAIRDIAAHMRTDEWVLIGGQMVAMHGFIAGTTPPRATTDIDIVANVMVRVGALGSEVEIIVPDMRGAMVLKARAAAADRRDTERHFADLAFLCSVVADPIELRGQLDTKERSSLLRVVLPDDPRSPPWVFLDAAARLNAVETWRLLRQK